MIITVSGEAQRSQMDELIELVAKAIFEQRYKAPGTYQFLPWEQYLNQELYRADARAAIEVIKKGGSPCGVCGSLVYKGLPTDE